MLSVVEFSYGANRYLQDRDVNGDLRFGRRVSVTRDFHRGLNPRAAQKWSSDLVRAVAKLKHRRYTEWRKNESSFSEVSMARQVWNIPVSVLISTM